MFTFSVETFISKQSLVHWNKRGMRTLQMTVLGSSLPPLSPFFLEGLSISEHDFTPGVACQPEDNKEWVVFIDTNPSFSVYTEVALLAAQRLIIPLNADDFSRQALESPNLSSIQYTGSLKLIIDCRMIFNFMTRN